MDNPIFGDMKPIVDLFVSLVSAGMNEDQALKLLAYIVVLTTKIPNPFGSIGE